MGVKHLNVFISNFQNKYVSISAIIQTFNSIAVDVIIDDVIDLVNNCYLYKKQNANEYLANPIFRSIIQPNISKINICKNLTPNFSKLFVKNSKVNRNIHTSDEVINSKNLQIGKNIRCSEMTYVIFENDNDSDEAINKIQKKKFEFLENNRQKKKNNKIIKINDLPFGLWQCDYCGTVNFLTNWPKCTKCKCFC